MRVETADVAVTSSYPWHSLESMGTLVDGVTKSMGNGIRSTWPCVRLSVPISGWSQQSYVVPVLVCLSQDGRSSHMLCLS